MLEGVPKTSGAIEPEVFVFHLWKMALRPRARGHFGEPQFR
jgi:hypothetical protein